MGVADWRAWTDQNGGQIPTATTAPGVPPTTFTTNSPFPGVLPITDLISGSTSIPTYPNTPTTVNAVDPFYVGTYPTGGGWMAQMLLTTYTGGVAYGASGGVNPGAGSSVGAGPIPRPAVAGITTP